MVLETILAIQWRCMVVRSLRTKTGIYSSMETNGARRVLELRNNASVLVFNQLFKRIIIADEHRYLVKGWRVSVPCLYYGPTCPADHYVRTHIDADANTVCST